METILGLFERLEDARRSALALREAGFPSEGVNILSGEEINEDTATPEEAGHEALALKEVANRTANQVLGALATLVISAENARLYAQWVKRGGALVIVHTPSAYGSEAVSLMMHFQPADILCIEPRWPGAQRQQQEEEEVYIPLLWKQLQDSS